MHTPLLPLLDMFVLNIRWWIIPPTQHRGKAVNIRANQPGKVVLTACQGDYHIALTNQAMSCNLVIMYLSISYLFHSSFPLPSVRCRFILHADIWLDIICYEFCYGAYPCILRWCSTIGVAFLHQVILKLSRRRVSSWMKKSLEGWDTWNVFCSAWNHWERRSW